MMYPRLRDSVIRIVEEPLLYNYVRDELFRIDEGAIKLLRHCTGKNSIEDLKILFGNEAGEIIDYLVEEECIEDHHLPEADKIMDVERLYTPSLRYLEIYITDKCNLSCSHCFLGDKPSRIMDVRLFSGVVEEFTRFGFKLLITGGEPLTHPYIWDILELSSSYPLRRILLTNGTLISEYLAKRLSKYVHEVQISIDGMKRGHERLRGKNTFERTMKGLKNALKFMPVSVATVIHSENIEELDELETMLIEMGVREWNLDFLIETGSLQENKELIPEINDAIKAFQRYGFGEGIHTGDEGLSCGAHLCSVMPDGRITKCGFFDEPFWRFQKGGLLRAWKKITESCIPELDVLECADCTYLSECRGGCRFRAYLTGDFMGKDHVMCRLFEFLKNSS